MTTFFISTWWMDCKNVKKKNFSRWLFEIIHIFWSEIWDLRSKDLKIFLGHDINYLSIWPFMSHPWFPTRKASKLIFFCFQLQLLNIMQGHILCVKLFMPWIIFFSLSGIMELIGLQWAWVLIPPGCWATKASLES